MSLTNNTNPESVYFFPSPPSLYERLGSRDTLTLMGPGIIVASATIGSGELVLASRSGAIFGYTMLWCFIYAGVFKALQVYSGCRFLVLTGEHPLTAWRRIPGPWMLVPMLIVLPILIIIPIMTSAIAELLGTFIAQLAKWPSFDTKVGLWQGDEFVQNLWSTFAIVVAFILARQSNYGVVEKISAVVLAFMILLITASTISSGPHLLEIANGLFVPRVNDFDNWIVSSPKFGEAFQNSSPWIEVALYLWAVGGGTQDYIGYVGMTREKNWGVSGCSKTSLEQLRHALKSDRAAEETRRARLWLRAPVIDTTLSFAIVVFITLLFAMLGAQVLHPAHIVPEGNDLVTVQEAFLTRLHPTFSIFYQVTVFLALGGTLYSLFQVYGVSLCESFNAFFRRKATSDGLVRFRIFQYLIFTLSTLLVWLPAYLNGDILGRISFASVIGGATSTAIWLFAMLWVDWRLLPTQLRMHPVLAVMVGIAGLSMTILGVHTIVAFFSLGI